MYTLIITGEAKSDIAALKKSGNVSAIKKVSKLLQELIVHPQSGTGRVEQLKGNLSGLWSRRIDKKNRLVYSIDENAKTVTVISATGHYD